MESSKPKTLEDFPKFIVTAVRRGATSETGYTRFELAGSFDHIIENISPYWFWLLFGERGCLCASLKSLDKQTRAAILTCDEKDEPDVVGQALAYLSPYWQAFNVWMVRDPSWGWEKKEFRGIDAVAEDYESKDVSIVEGREVRVWTKLAPAEGSEGQGRHHPAKDQTLPPLRETRLVPSGWDHEHCELCKAHIDAGTFGYCDPGERWMCKKCFERYIIPRDLAFVDEL
ncbi:MAG TPA: hypothetical protein VE377_12050 [Candidatus Dormibacteraeota bacterium]|nr:hypothetical protein [Candidatus Dormibacteraeota bacterium]